MESIIKSFFKAKKSNWRKHDNKKAQEQDLLNSLEKEIAKQQKLVVPNEKPSEQLENAILIKKMIQIFHHMQTLLYERSHLEKEHVYDFPVLISQLCALMCIFIDIHCKSAKDRTGAVLELIEICRLLENLEPEIAANKRFDFEYIQEKFSSLITRILNSSASGAIPERNTNTAGKQVTDKFCFNTLNQATENNKMAHLAKYPHEEDLPDTSWTLEDYRASLYEAKTFIPCLELIDGQQEYSSFGLFAKTSDNTPEEAVIINAYKILKDKLNKNKNKKLYEISAAETVDDDQEAIDAVVNTRNQRNNVRHHRKNRNVISTSVNKHNIGLEEGKARVHKYEDGLYIEKKGNIEIRGLPNTIKGKANVIAKIVLDMLAQNPNRDQVEIYGTAEIVTLFMHACHQIGITPKSIDCSQMNKQEQTTIEKLAEELFEGDMINFINNNHNNHDHAAQCKSLI